MENTGNHEHEMVVGSMTSMWSDNTSSDLATYLLMLQETDILSQAEQMLSSLTYLLLCPLVDSTTGLLPMPSACFFSNIPREYYP